ncbi:ubiquitin ligase E3 alpha [Anopheles sinensis]|uniref:E3 ubiquitin-protein ligase n=1 Tax=Anopheles sinensis TaxID=74873 RepID=A0A084WPV3_ANOSI|nr:ubiquitin ligase E3 alpha [Anopheles sinensis]
MFPHSPPIAYVKHLLDLYDQQILEPRNIEQYFRTVAETYVQVEPNQTEQECFTFKEQGIQETIMVLETFICGEDSTAFLEQLKRNDFDSSVCGRVFKIGEPTYSCRECSMDPTCVLCSSCFKNSPHRIHKYKMATSSGGGCCDCGDVEAWKQYPVCAEHNNISNISSESTAQLPDDVQGRCAIVFQAILAYCMRVLKMDSDGSYSELDDDDNTHCTVLYNDETHTFEQVIQALTSIVLCSQKTAIEYVTSIDREGRAVVKCASFEVCKKLKEDIETKAIRTTVGGKMAPLKVTVMHRNEVACQHLAIQMLGWFQEFLSKHSSFRNIFVKLIGIAGTGFNLKLILGNDHKLWKSARSCWHRLLISGMLMEYENKKQLALTFTRQYTALMQAFVRDDHYHSFSIVSLSVQLFTVPTIAHCLIGEEAAFFKLMHTFYSEAIEKYIKNRQLQFARNTSTLNVFKRASYILVDLRYLLSFKPYVWIDALRSGFLHGVQVLIRLLKCMQGMDAVTRQVGQHMEYELEWETAFTLHLKLSHLITLVLEWCATDKVVLIKVYRMLLTALTDVKFIVPETVPVACEAANHTAYCLQYDVASMPVSVHLPLTRFLAGLYTAFERHDLPFANETAKQADRPTPEQIIEPVLCTRAMISQVHAGLWRRNGYSLLNQLYFYRNVKCRYEMLDRDIVILQVGASLIEANEFIIHVLHKFMLLEWLKSDQIEKPARLGGAEDDYLRQAIILVEELLELLIVIISERHVPGVGDVTEGDRIKKEIVQLLCIKPHSHSELSRALNEDNCSETAIESVIDDVAVFEKPNVADKKGVYKLKPEYYSWYNLYFYHYSKEEKSKSEEAQRNRRKEKGELVCCPPPELPKLTKAFSILPNLLQCDVMLEIIRVILTRALDLQSTSFSEGQLQRVLHLIGYAIQEEKSGYYPYLKFIERSQTIGLLALLDELTRSQRVESQRDLLRWVIQRFKSLEASKKKATEELATSASDEGAGPSEATGGSDASELDAERNAKEKRAKMAAMRRAQLLAQMQNMQQSFMKSNAALFNRADDEEEECAAGTSDAGAAGGDMAMEWQSGEGGSTSAAMASTVKTPVCLGRNRQAPRWKAGEYFSTAQRHTCILCSEESVLTARSHTCMVYAAFVQRSSVLSRYQQTDERGQLQYIETGIHPSPHISTCGHVMHLDCFEKYFKNEVVKENRRPYRNRMPILFDVEKQEFLCPLCRCLSNCLLPLVPHLDGILKPGAYDDEHPEEATETGAASEPGASTSSATAASMLSADPNFNFRSWYELMNGFLAQMQKQVSTAETVKPRLGARSALAMTDNLGLSPSELAGPLPSGILPTPDLLHDRDLLEPFDPQAYDPIERVEVAGLARVEGGGDEGGLEGPSCGLFHELVEVNLQKFCTVVNEYTAVPPTAKGFSEYLAVWLACSYTIKSLEMLLRVMERPLGAELTIRHESCLRGLVRASCVVGSIMPSNKFHTSVRDYAVDLYDTLFGNKPSNSFFEWDLFAILNTCLFTTRYVFFQAVPSERIPRGDAIDHAILQAVFMFNVLRTIVTSTVQKETDDDESGTAMETDQDEKPPELTEAERTLLRLYRTYNIYIQREPGWNSETAAEAGADPAERKKKVLQERRLCRALLCDIRKKSHPLLRCCCLLFRYITDVELPEGRGPGDDGADEDDYRLMVTYLDLAVDPLAYFAPGELSLELIERLAAANNESIHRMHLVRLGGMPLFPAGPPVRQLIDLPEDYSDLINSVSLFTCPNNVRDDSRNPTMCLVCGEILCSQSFCCQKELDKVLVGSCTYHTAECGAGIGIFLRIRDAEILLLGINKGCFIAAPYLDEYGETDQGLRRGNPLRLCKERYQKLHQTWLSHALHEEITRRNESQQTLFATQWQNL